MKAIRIHEHGGADMLRYEDVAEPNLLAPTDALVKLRAASLNRGDLDVRRGLTGTKLKFPHIPGSDAAGVVIEVGTAVTNVAPGDAVCVFPASGCGHCEFCISDNEFLCGQLNVIGQQEDGTYAGYLRISARNCFPLPASLSFEEAAALPLAYTSAWRMLVTNAELKPGQDVLIRGTDETAIASVLIAVQLGARVFVVSDNSEKLAKIRALGAENTIHYSQTDFAKEVRHRTGKRGVDVVVDCIGGNGWSHSIASLAKGARLVTCGANSGSNPPTDLRRIFWNDLKIFGSNLGDRKDFRQMLNFMQNSRIKPIIDQVLPLRDAAAAQERLEKNEAFGKLVLQIGE